MIIWGIQTKHLKSETVAGYCANCNYQNSVQISVFQRWAHIFWIPYFPVGKIGFSDCANCKQVLTHKEMPASSKINYDNLKSQTKTPLWTFSGVGIIILLVIGVIVSEKQTAKKVTQMIPSLKKDDIVQIHLLSKGFTLAKVSRIKGDSVFLFVNKFKTDRESGIDDLKDKEYDTLEEALTVADLKAMDKKKQILDIERD